ncbi:hypothetical protein N3K66_001617 [Trichothecium roseum]|uniref:Uncharacterized protein n=1 Tax=Trichothecium roseum TaxID=47278 RepID=A0ACC0VH40_9HYPO|nr:hypothetical protein N3K66_001617 [Trichothecium roseum]
MESQQSPDTAKGVQAKAEREQLLARIDAFAGARWLRVFWCDYSAGIKCRLIPLSLVKARLRRGEPVTVAIIKASLGGLLPNDRMVPGVSAVGGYLLVPDWSSLRAGPTRGQITCVGEFREKDGSAVAACPRTALRSVLGRAEEEHGLEFILGFEIEFTVMEMDPAGSGQYVAVRNHGHQWSTARNLADWGRPGAFASVLDDLADDLAAADIGVEQLHVESAPGQYEVVLSAAPALRACDNYLVARQIVEAAAARSGFRVTMHPKLYPDAPGNAAHVHMSISSPFGDDANLYEPFYAGVLTHLRAVTAFTYASPVSYERAADSSWAGGRWVAWGSENRETPLRKCQGGHWEFRLLDGMANPYLALAAVLGAGADGVGRGTGLSAWGECLGDPAAMSEGERREFGIVERLPGSLSEALDALRTSERFGEVIGRAVVDRQVALKKAEIELLQSMEEAERRQWIIARF